MSGLTRLIEQCYEQAKKGAWDRVLTEWSECNVIAKRCSRYQKETSGWSFLHQAAYFGNIEACNELIRLGASPSKLTYDRKTPAVIAEQKGFSTLAALLKRAEFENDSLWITSSDPDLLPSSCLWSEAIEKRSTETMLIAYAADVIKIPVNSQYYTDSLNRILIGWHGTYNPPCDMDGQSMLISSSRA